MVSRSAGSTQPLRGRAAWTARNPSGIRACWVGERCLDRRARATKGVKTVAVPTVLACNERRNTNTQTRAGHAGAETPPGGRRCPRDRLVGQHLRIDVMTEDDLGSVLAIERQSFDDPWPAEVFRAELRHSWSHCHVLRGEAAAVVGYDEDEEDY